MFGGDRTGSSPGATCRLRECGGGLGGQVFLSRGTFWGGGGSRFTLSFRKGTLPLRPRYQGPDELTTSVCCSFVGVLFGMRGGFRRTRRLRIRPVLWRRLLALHDFKGENAY